MIDEDYSPYLRFLRQKLRATGASNAITAGKTSPLKEQSASLPPSKGEESDRFIVVHNANE